MPDRLIFSSVLGDGLETFDVGGGLSWLLEQLDAEYDRALLAAVTNEKPGEDGESSTYFLQRYVVEDGAREIRECTCPAFRFQQVPKPEQIRRGDVSLDMIGECKHLREHRKRSRTDADRDDSQRGLDDLLDGDGGGFA